MKEKIVCILTQEYMRGATWIYSEELAKAMKRQSDWKPILITALRDEKLTPKPEKSDIPIEFIKTTSSRLFYSNSYWKGTNPIVNSKNPSIIHGNLPMLSTRKIKTTRPIVETVHTTFYGEQKSIIEEPSTTLNWVERRLLLGYPIMSRIETKLMKQASHLIAVSEPIKQEIIENYPVKESKVTVVPNGVDTTKYVRVEQKIYEKSDEEFVIGFLGRLMIRKGSELLIPILKKVKSMNPKVKLLFAGDDLNQRKNFIKALKDNNLSESVIDLGYIDENMKNSFFSSIDLFLLPSNYEGMNLTLLEALSCQTPILAAPEAVTFDHGSTIITTKRNAKSFADKIIELMENKQQLSSIAKKSREIAEKYTWDNTAKQTIKIYEKIL